MPRRIANGRSIQQKISGVIVALTLSIVAFLVVYFPTRQIHKLQADLEKKAATYGHLLSREVESAVAFGDRQTAREVFEAAAADTDLRAVGLYTDRGDPLHVVGEFSDGVTTANPSVFRVETTKSSVRCVAPVVSKEGPRGLLVLELSTAGLDRERARILRDSILVGLGALVAGFVAAWLIGRSLAKRLRAIARVTVAVADGDLSHPSISDDDPDEIGQLARSANAMLDGIRALVDQISKAATEENVRLDRLMSELDVRNRDMRLVLDHVREGFLTLDPQGMMSLERSKIVDSWLGPAREDTPFWDQIAQLDQRTATWFKLGWGAIFDGFFPVEVALEQMPKEMQIGSTFLRFAYTPILVDDAVSKVLLVISDVTDQVARERAEELQREFLGILDRVTKDRAGLLEFFLEGEQLVRLVASGAATSRSQVMRAIHTLKGNSGFFGLRSVAEFCGKMEDLVGDGGEMPSAAMRAELATRWETVSFSVRALIGERRSRKVEIDANEHAAILEAIRNGTSRTDLAHSIALWQLEPTEVRLARIAEQTRALAVRLGKSLLNLSIEPNGLRLDPERWAPFWAAFAHMVRNAVDHGIEPEEERRAAGKPGAGTVRLRTCLSGTQVLVEIADDGRGIDWDALRARGKAMGLPHESNAELEELLFRDGVSTKADASEFSGRGVGLGAVRAECEALGGVVRVASARGQGATFQFLIPFPPSAQSKHWFASVAPRALG